MARRPNNSGRMTEPAPCHSSRKRDSVIAGSSSTSTARRTFSDEAARAISIKAVRSLLASFDSTSTS